MGEPWSNGKCCCMVQVGSVSSLGKVGETWSNGKCCCHVTKKSYVQNLEKLYMLGGKSCVDLFLPRPHLVGALHIGVLFGLKTIKKPLMGNNPTQVQLKEIIGVPMTV